MKNERVRIVETYRADAMPEHLWFFHPLDLAKYERERQLEAIRSLGEPPHWLAKAKQCP